jgi:glycosyltransferase involved in cell wall biosynthesis
MKICVDGAPFEASYQIGIWRATYETIARLASRADITLWLGSRSLQPIPHGVGVARDSSRVGFRRLDVITGARYLASQLCPPRALARADVYHSTYFSSCGVSGPARVVSVYDMVPERFFAILSGWAEGGIARKRDAIQAATLIVCISHATAADLVSFYPEAAARVRVVPLGADHLRGPVSSKLAEDRDAFVLFVGNRDQYKNFWVLPYAIKHNVWPRGLSLRVVGPPAAEHELNLLGALGLSERVQFLGRLSDDDLRRQYRSARAFIYPSLMEGFGLPILEAQINECPVVCSDIPAFREVAAESAVFSDPRLPERLAEAVARVCDPSERSRLVAAGRGNVPRFSWDKAASQTLAVYEEAAQIGSKAH